MTNHGKLALKLQSPSEGSLSASDSQPSMPLKLFILRGEAKSYGFSKTCVPESMINYLK